MKRIKLLVGRLLVKILIRVYDLPMNIIKTHSGNEFIEVITPSGVTGYVDTSVPMRALVGLRAKLQAKLDAGTSAEPDSTLPLSPHQQDPA